MIEVKGLSYTYKGQKAIAFPDFTINQGEHCLLLGSSGSGKTTLLHVLGGLLRSYQGSVIAIGQELAHLSESALDSFRGKHMGFIFQKNHLITALSVEDNLKLAPYLAGTSIDEKRIGEVLKRLGIESKRTAKVTEISQGQAQRVAIARAVMHKPAIILADEPTSALDDKSCEQVIHLLMEVAKENKASLIVATHDQRIKSYISKQVILTPQH